MLESGEIQSGDIQSGGIEASESQLKPMINKPTLNTQSEITIRALPSLGSQLNLRIDLPSPLTHLT